MPLGNAEVQQISMIEKRADGNLTTLKTIPAKFTQLETA